MAKTGLVNISANNTFQVWLDRTNELVNIIGTDVLTASASPGDTTGSVSSPKVATLIGTFTANTITAETRLRTDKIETTSTDVTIEAPTVISSSQAVGLESFSNSANPVLRLNNNSVSWDVGFLDAQNFTINDGSGVERLKLTPAGDLTIAGSITTSGGGAVTADVTGNITGDVTGNLTGNVTGNVTGDVTGNLTGNASTASSLQTARTIGLSGAVTGSASFDGSSNITISTTATSDPTLTLTGDASGSATFTNLGNATLNVTVADDSHNHTISNIDGLQTTLNGFLTSNQVLAVAQSTSIGVNQTWQDVLSNRFHNTPEQNLTGKPIMVSIYDSYGAQVQISSVSSTGPWITIGTLGQFGDWANSITFVVPDGHWYRTTGGVLTGLQRVIWAELR